MYEAVNMKKCSLCKCLEDDYNKLEFLPYSKGDFFCRSCLNMLLGVRRCLVCSEEFYYTTKNKNKQVCSTGMCRYKYQRLKTKIRKNVELTSDDKENINLWGL